MSKAESFPVLILTCQKTDYFDNTRPPYFYFEDWYLHQGKMKPYSLIILFSCACIDTTVDIIHEHKEIFKGFDMESTINMMECFHIHLIDFM